MKTREIVLAKAFFSSIVCLCFFFNTVTPACAQDVITYTFNGNVASMNAGSSIFPGITIGSPVSGQFSIDYGAASQGADSANYPSANVNFSGLLDGFMFGSAPDAGNMVRVVNDDTSSGADWIIFFIKPQVPSHTTEMRLTFYDPTRAMLDNSALPTPAVFNQNPTATLYLVGGVGFGFYTLNLSIAQVPEPSTTALLLSLVPLYLVYRRRTSSAH